MLARLIRPIAFVLCGALALAGPPARAADAPYDINVILSLSGQGAFIGKGYQDVFSLLQTTVNKRGGIKGQPIRFVFQDDQTSPQVAVQLANAVIAKGVPILLGPTITGTCRAVAPLVTNGPVDYCLSPGLHPVKDSYNYSVSTATSDMIGVALKYFRDRRWHRIARITTTDATGQDADDSFKSWLALPENKDLSVVAEEHFSVTDLSVAAQMSRIKAAQPQVVIVWATGTPLATALHAFGDAGIETPMFVTNANMVTAQSKQYANITPKEYYSAAPGYVANIAPSAESRKAQQEYFSALSSAGIHNDYITGLVWDAALIVVSALQKVGTQATAAQIRDYIAHQSKFAGIAGTYDFTDGSQRGLTGKDIMVMRYDKASGEWVSVSNFGGVPKR
jgi:branched-chain amino acid transport system substrate-binding protein